MKRFFIVLFTVMLISGCSVNEETSSVDEPSSTNTTQSTTTHESTTISTTTSKDTTTTKKTTKEKNYFKVGSKKVYYGTYKQSEGYVGDEYQKEVVVLNKDKTCTYKTTDKKSFKCTYKGEHSKYVNPDGSVEYFDSIVLKLDKKYNGHKDVTFMLSKDTLSDQWHELKRVK